MENPHFYGEATRPAPESYVTQSLTLSEIQAENARYLHDSGISGRACATLHEAIRKKIENAQPILVQTAVYQSRHFGQTSDLGDAQFGVRFSITDDQSKSTQNTRHYYVTIGELHENKPTPFQDSPDSQIIWDTNRVAFLVDGLRRAINDGVLPNLSADLTKINDFESSFSSVPPQKQ